MTPEDLDEYLNKFIKPALEEYAKEHNISVEELLLQLTTQKEPKIDNNKDETHHKK